MPITKNNACNIRQQKKLVHDRGKIEVVGILMKNKNICLSREHGTTVLVFRHVETQWGNFVNLLFVFLFFPSFFAFLFWREAIGVGD